MEVTASKTKNEVFPAHYLDDIKDNYMAPVFSKVLERLKPEKILDYGCGNGVFGIYFKQHHEVEIIGVDGSDYALKGAPDRGYDETTLISDFCTQKLPYEEQSFDLIICKDVLEHMLTPAFLVEEMRRVLKPGGMALVHIPNHFPLYYRLKFLFTADIDTQNYFTSSEEWDFPHIRFFTHPGFRRLIEFCGFELVEDFSNYSTVYFPKTARIPGLKQIQKYLSGVYPTHFANGFTFLIKSKN